MEFQDVIATRRTIRLFRNQPVERTKILTLLTAATHASSGINRQPLRFIVVERPSAIKQLLEHTRWGALVNGKRTPEWGKTAPAAFIVLASAEMPSPLLYQDTGAAAMSISMAACDQGLGCCWMASFDPERLKQDLGLVSAWCIPAIMAIGYPAETPRCIPIGAGASTRYFLDEEGTLNIPKYTVEAVTQWI